MLTDEDREQFRTWLNRYIENYRGADPALDMQIKFMLDLDERIERLRNPLTPESKGK